MRETTKIIQENNFNEDIFMRKNVIKTVICIALNTAVLTAAYKLGEKNGYEDGWNDGEMTSACERCCYGGEEECSADIPDFEEYCR